MRMMMVVFNVLWMCIASLSLLHSPDCSFFASFFFFSHLFQRTYKKKEIIPILNKHHGQPSILLNARFFFSTAQLCPKCSLDCLKTCNSQSIQKEKSRSLYTFSLSLHPRQYLTITCDVFHTKNDNFSKYR